jgi:hypothetical protein
VRIGIGILEERLKNMGTKVERTVGAEVQKIDLSLRSAGSA